MSEATELLPCPFCGKEAKIYQSSDCCTHEMMTVSCSECFAQVNFDQDTEPAISAWNTRAPDPRVAALVAALREIRDSPCMDPEGNSAIAAEALEAMGER